VGSEVGQRALRGPHEHGVDRHRSPDMPVVTLPLTLEGAGEQK
jgi:hypothetical protein